ncbi:MAG: ABC transporter permease subunit [Actinomycetia bacterium]|nr:ABC transporter permease subunit [Actinomycetes bacterium]
MTTQVREEPDTATEPGTERRPPWRAIAIGGVLVVWVVVGLVLNGVDTLTLAKADQTGFQEWLLDLGNDVREAAATNGVTAGIADAINAVFTFLQELISEPAFPRPVPEIGWLGVITLATWVALFLAGWRMAVLTAASFALFGFLGYWEDSMDTLIVIFMAVALVLIIGVPLGIWMSRQKIVNTILSPVLDVLQTIPAFVYLLPFTAFFGIGPAAAVLVTALYAFAPVTRITAHAIRTVSPSLIEVGESLGSTRGQTLRKVQLPAAKRTIFVGLNQTIMAALAMVTIAAFIDGPGLGAPVIQALQSLDVGNAFVAGLGIVIMAIMLDRVTTAASVHGERLARTSQRERRLRYGVLAVTGVASLVAVYLSRTYLWAAEFPEQANVGSDLARATQSASDWLTTNAYDVTVGIKNAVTYGLLNPLQSLLSESPWWLVAAVLVLLALLLGGIRAFVTAIVCLAIVLGVGLWQDSMVTLASTLVATVITMVLALVFGVWMAQSATTDRIVRPILDAAQVIPPFVYLVPALGLFQSTRFTAIVAAVVYASPVATKLVCDAIRGVSPTVIEAARASGATRWQIIGKVQLPMARSGIALAANQGMLYVFSMVVIGGLVGAGALGYIVVAGFSQAELFGKGLAAGIAICALAIMLDRVAQGLSKGAGADSIATRPRPAPAVPPGA